MTECPMGQILRNHEEPRRGVTVSVSTLRTSNKRDQTIDPFVVALTLEQAALQMRGVPKGSSPLTLIKTSTEDIPFAANIHDWLPYSLVHIVPPPAGFGHNPLSNCFFEQAQEAKAKLGTNHQALARHFR
ncbi:uncharacterized protein MELLADRAFT_101139 [Melampsora larici-populina 98AG31]|uniref:Uncharacterized protein n=1 Tax=Melampsora larici-populina (strain 98AG31 / pathotype 3-4-7) TaxID=747676 RepID=F4R3R5_MELLP|nr:uncharacterized protein MELLADRAFT_101139 [Melampsora larici-populina 98AG31]EGG12673.1 hypothetical protein MELLADRAFT_101139 [Melampsora larici-populina 98AG31]